MPLVLCNKPNRSKPRLWTERDLARVAKHLQNKGVPIFKIFASVAVATGVAYLFCRAARTVELLIAFASLAEDIAVVLATSKLIQTLIRILSKRLIYAIPVVNRIAIAIIVILVALQALSDKVVSSLKDVSNVRTGLLFVDSICKSTQETITG